MATKICTKCGNEKDIDLFVVVSRYPDGHGAACKKCHNAYSRMKYVEDIDESRVRATIRTKKSYQKNKEKRKAYSREYYKTNKDKCNKHSVEYRRKNSDKVRVWKWRDAEKHKESNRIHNKEYRLKNKDKLNEKSRIYRNSSPENKLKHNLRNRIRIVLKGMRKGKHLPELVGCSVEFLRSYIESQFTEGMTWDNYGNGGWHIDHIIPCRAFTLTDVIHQLACFNWHNLQPMWGIPNISKGAKYDIDDFNKYMDWFIKIIDNKA